MSRAQQCSSSAVRVAAYPLFPIPYLRRIRSRHTRPGRSVAEAPACAGPAWLVQACSWHPSGSSNGSLTTSAASRRAFLCLHTRDSHARPRPWPRPRPRRRSRIPSRSKAPVALHAAQSMLSPQQHLSTVDRHSYSEDGDDGASLRKELLGRDMADLEAQDVALPKEEPTQQAHEYQVPLRTKLQYLAAYFLFNLGLTFYNKAVLGRVSVCLSSPPSARSDLFCSSHIPGCSLSFTPDPPPSAAMPWLWRGTSS